MAKKKAEILREYNLKIVFYCNTILRDVYSDCCSVTIPSLIMLMIMLIYIVGLCWS
jgi:hypothetical protein